MGTGYGTRAAWRVTYLDGQTEIIHSEYAAIVAQRLGYRIEAL